MTIDQYSGPSGLDVAVFGARAGSAPLRFALGPGFHMSPLVLWFLFEATDEIRESLLMF
jgi:hypothetical protein